MDRLVVTDQRQKRRHFGAVIADALGEKVDAVGRLKSVEKKLLEAAGG